MPGRPARRGVGGALLSAALAVSCAGAEQVAARPTTIGVARTDDPWLTGERCGPETPTEPAPRIEVIATGTGDPVGPGVTVRVHYVAQLPGGSVVHDSHDEGRAAEIIVGSIVGSTKTICGFERGLIGMRPGEQRRIVVPWSLAFGESGRPPEIPPRTDLVFVVDLYLPADVVNQHGMPPANPARGGGGRRR